MSSEKKIMIITDTGSDILEFEAEKMDIRMTSIRSSFPNTEFVTNSEEEFSRFYDLLAREEALPVSSQPSPQEFVSLYEEAREKDMDVIVITISSKLSGTYSGACLAKDISEYENVYVVDSLLATLAQRVLVEYACKLRDSGMRAKDIVKNLNEKKHKVVLTGVPTTMLYLKKGGRVSPVIAAVGDVLGIKPVLALREGVIVNIKKARGNSAAKSSMTKLMEETKPDYSFPIYFGYSGVFETGKAFMDETSEKYGLDNVVIHNVGPAIGTHIGPGALLLSFMAE